MSPVTENSSGAFLIRRRYLIGASCVFLTALLLLPALIQGAPAPKLKQKNPEKTGALANNVANMLRHAPDNPSFLYETRYIPDMPYKGEFLTAEVSNEIIRHQVSKEEKLVENNKNPLENIDSSIWIKILVVGVFVIILALYKLRVRRGIHR